MQESSSCIGLCISSSIMLTSESEARTVKEEGLTYRNHSKRLYCLNISHLGIMSSALIDTGLMLLALSKVACQGQSQRPQASAVAPGTVRKIHLHLSMLLMLAKSAALCVCFFAASMQHSAATAPHPWLHML